MKLLTQSVKRTGDNVTVNATWKTQDRRKAQVKIKRTIPEPGAFDEAMMTGDVKEVHGVLFGLAEIAWNMGWRPAGFIERIAGAVAAHKIPPS